MDASSLLKQVERLKTQLRDEKDGATQREMRKTIRHLYKQYRTATTQRTHWYGFGSNFLYLVALFLLVIGALAALVRVLGFWNTVGACFLATLVLVVLTSMAFLLMKIFSPAQYQKMVGTALTAFKNIWRHRVPNTGQELQASQDEEVID